MRVEIRAVPRPAWEPLPSEGCVGVEGDGYTSVAGETAALAAGQEVRWPRGVPHRLWTDGSTMTPLMVERIRP